MLITALQTILHISCTCMGTLGKISLPIWVEVKEKQTLQHSLSPVHAIQSILKILRTVYYLEQNTKCKLLVVAKISPLLFVQKKNLYSAIYPSSRNCCIHRRQNRTYRTHIKYIAFCKISIGQVLSTEVSIYYKSVVSIQVLDYIVLEKVLTM